MKGKIVVISLLLVLMVATLAVSVNAGIPPTNPLRKTTGSPAQVPSNTGTGIADTNVPEEVPLGSPPGGPVITPG